MGLHIQDKKENTQTAEWINAQHSALCVLLVLGVITKHVSKIRSQEESKKGMHIHEPPEETISGWILESWFSVNCKSV